MQIVALPNGGAVAVWRTIDATFTNPQIATSNYDATTGAWSAPVILAPTGGRRHEQLRVHPARPGRQRERSTRRRGSPWRRERPGAAHRVAPPAGATAWSAPEQAPADFSSGYAAPRLQRGVSLAFRGRRLADGGLAAAWPDPARSNGDSLGIRTWTATGVLGFDGGYPLATAIATTPSGRTTVVWADVSRNALFTADRAAGATSWSEPTNLNSFPFSVQPA